MYISLKTIWERHFPPFSRPLFSQPSQINVNLSDYYGEIMTSVGKLVFSLRREDISVQTVARPPITKNFQESKLFVWASLTGPNTTLSNDLPQALIIVKFIGWYLVGLNPCQAIPGGDMIRADLVSRDLETSTWASWVKSNDPVTARINSLSLN